MTIANRQGRDAGGGGAEPGRGKGAFRKAEGDSRKKKTRSRALNEGGGRPKGEADVADLLAVSALESGIFPAINPDAGADALLDVMVQADLQRAERGGGGGGAGTGGEKNGEKGGAEKAAGAEEDGARVVEQDVIDEPVNSGEDRSELLKKEIEALLARSPEDEPGEAPADGDAAAPAWNAEDMTAGAAGATVTSEELAVLLPEGGTGEDVAGSAGKGLDDVNAWPEISSPMEQAAGQAAPAGGMPVSSAAAELAREMAADSALHAPAAQGASKPAVDPLGAADEDDARRMVEAEGELEKELAELVKQAPEPAASEETPGALETIQAQGAASAAVGQPEAGAAHLAAAEAAGAEKAVAAPMEIPVPVVILQPDEEEEEPAAPGVLGRVWSVVSEVALMGAQLIDLPFSWIRGLDKHIIGVAAVIFFLSGCVLMLLGWWLGAR